MNEKILDLKEQIASNDELQGLFKEDERLKVEFRQKKTRLFNQNFKLYVLKHDLDLAIQHKDNGLNEFKKLKVEQERLETLLKETRKSNAIKVERKIRENESIPLKQS